MNPATKFSVISFFKKIQRWQKVSMAIVLFVFSGAYIFLFVDLDNHGGSQWSTRASYSKPDTVDLVFKSYAPYSRPLYNVEKSSSSLDGSFRIERSPRSIFFGVVMWLFINILFLIPAQFVLKRIIALRGVWRNAGGVLALVVFVPLVFAALVLGAFFVPMFNTFITMGYVSGGGWSIDPDNLFFFLPGLALIIAINLFVMIGAVIIGKRRISSYAT